MCNGARGWLERGQDDSGAHRGKDRAGRGYRFGFPEAVASQRSPGAWPPEHMFRLSVCPSLLALSDPPVLLSPACDGVDEA